MYINTQHGNPTGPAEEKREISFNKILPDTSFKTIRESPQLRQARNPIISIELIDIEPDPLF
jgi:hypothetical protein